MQASYAIRRDPPAQDLLYRADRVARSSPSSWYVPQCVQQLIFIHSFIHMIKSMCYKEIHRAENN